MLRFLERNFVWPGLDQIEASREAEPLMRKLLAIVLSSPEMAGRTEREVYQRITALGSMCMSVCYSSILEGAVKSGSSGCCSTARQASLSSW